MPLVQNGRGVNAIYDATDVTEWREMKVSVRDGGERRGMRGDEMLL